MGGGEAKSGFLGPWHIPELPWFCRLHRRVPTPFLLLGGWMEGGLGRQVGILLLFPPFFLPPLLYSEDLFNLRFYCSLSYWEHSLGLDLGNFLRARGGGGALGRRWAWRWAATIAALAAIDVVAATAGVPPLRVGPPCPPGAGLQVTLRVTLAMGGSPGESGRKARGRGGLFESLTVLKTCGSPRTVVVAGASSL